MEFLSRKNLFVMIDVWWLVSMLDRTEYQSLSSELLLIEKLKGKNFANCRKPVESYALFSIEILRKNSELILTVSRSEDVSLGFQKIMPQS